MNYRIKNIQYSNTRGQAVINGLGVVIGRRCIAPHALSLMLAVIERAINGPLRNVDTSLLCDMPGRRALKEAAWPSFCSTIVADVVISGLMTVPLLYQF